MKKARRTLMALGVVVFSLSAALTAKIKEKSVLAQLNCSKAKPITSSWGDDKHIFSSFDDQKALSVDASNGSDEDGHYQRKRYQETPGHFYAWIFKTISMV